MVPYSLVSDDARVILARYCSRFLLDAFDNSFAQVDASGFGGNLRLNRKNDRRRSGQHNWPLLGNLLPQLIRGTRQEN